MRWNTSSKCLRNEQKMSLTPRYLWDFAPLPAYEGKKPTQSLTQIARAYTRTRKRRRYVGSVVVAPNTVISFRISRCAPRCASGIRSRKEKR
ncbi:hypothetical protein V3C99_004267 [Haemonchus contortus]